MNSSSIAMASLRKGSQVRALDISIPNRLAEAVEPSLSLNIHA